MSTLKQPSLEEITGGEGVVVQSEESRGWGGLWEADREGIRERGL